MFSSNAAGVADTKSVLHLGLLCAARLVESMALGSKVVRDFGQALEVLIMSL
jgi:hypothetical protein